MPSRFKIFARALLLIPVIAVVSILVLNPSRFFHDALFRPNPLSLIVRTAKNVPTAAEIAPLVQRFRANNVKTVWVQFKQDETEECEGGQAFYPSRIAPVAKGYEDDHLRAFVDALVSAGIEVYAWVPTLHDPAAMRMHPDWAAQMYNEDEEPMPNDGWLCPANPDAVRYEAAVAAEVVAHYPKVKGLYMDFVRYDSDFACTCPRCLREVERRSNWRATNQAALGAMDIIDAGNRRKPPWSYWLKYRAEQVCGAVSAVSRAVKAARASCLVGASVLPFSAKGYSTNTQSGQDLRAMSQAGLDEMAMMCYWDDWSKSPAWVNESLKAAALQVKAPCKLICILDGDQSVRRTRLTLDALDDWTGPRTFFRYDEWSDRNFDMFRKGIDGHDKEGKLPKSAQVDVVIRIDTEPDAEDRWDTIHPEMVQRITQLLESEGIRGTFITCAHLAELQPESIRQAAARGHEIGIHAYAHEQLDALPVPEQIAIIDKSLQTYRRLGITVFGFGAPRNSGTDATYDREIEWNLEYDCSESYDPAVEFEDVSYHYYDGPKPARIVVIPYVEPNDWDASQVNPEGMLADWERRLDLVLENGEPCFVLDVHQWLVSTPDNLDSLRQFIRYAKTKPQCRFTTLRQAAKDARALLDRYEPPCPTSGDNPPPIAALSPIPASAAPAMQTTVPARPGSPPPRTPSSAHLTVENRDRPAARSPGR